MKTLPFIFLTALFFSCVKNKYEYEEGGLAKDAATNIYAQDGEWYLKRYEVNGADSTKNLFTRKDSLRNPLRFKVYKTRSGSDFQGFIESDEYRVPFDFINGNKTLSSSGNGDKCPCVVSLNDCIKNIFHHNFTKRDEWIIIKLTSEELVMKTYFKKDYKVSLKRGV